MAAIDESLTPLPSAKSARNSLFSPALDFLLLGGGSLIALLALRIALDGKDLEISASATILLANFINNPHFAHSYQMFYRDFGVKLASYPMSLRIRYAVAGIAVPVALAVFFALTVYLDAIRVLGLGANLMFFLVGWHYVKQGYGMSMVDAVLKRAFYSESEKKQFLQNAYAVWFFSWLLLNYLALGKAANYAGIQYFVLPVPQFLLLFSALVCIYTSLRVAFALKRRIASGQAVAWNGVLAYCVSLYAWLLIRDPVVLLWVPLFHSLQYLAVVWRYEANRNRSISPASSSVKKMFVFSGSALILGYLGFFMVPEWLNENVGYSKEIFGGMLFTFIFWIFINVHHYAMDAVIWRKGNPDVQAHLFKH